MSRVKFLDSKDDYNFISKNVLETTN